MMKARPRLCKSREIRRLSKSDASERTITDRRNVRLRGHASSRRYTHSNVQELADGLVIAGTAVSHSQGVHAAPTQDRVLVGAQGRHQGIGLLEAAVHREGDADREAP